MKENKGICVAIIVMVSLFYLFTLRAGQPWPDDFAMYIHEAKNFVDRIPLSHTGYIYDPQNPSLGPKLYPPVVPLFLTPGYIVGGIKNLTPMKIEIVLFFIGTLILLWRGLGRDLPPMERAAMLAVVGFNPTIWASKDLIVSDIPFTFLLYATLLIADRLAGFDTGERKGRVWLIAALAGLIYLCYGSRTVGIVLIPCFLLYGAIYWRQKSGRYMAAAGMLGLLPCFIQSKLFGAELSYGDQLHFSVSENIHVFVQNVAVYGWSLATFWENPYSKAFRDLLFIGLTLLALIGYLRKVRTGPRVYEIFLPLYLIVILLFPLPGGSRYLIPIFPLYVFYFLHGIDALGARAFIRAGRVLVPLTALILICYGAEFAHASFGPYEGIDKKESQDLFAFIDSNTRASDVLIFRRPRALALFTGRSAAIYPESPSTEPFPAYFRSIGATYLLEAPGLDDPGFDTFVDESCFPKQLVFSNSDFRVFHVQPQDMRACSDQDVAKNPPTAHLP